MVPLGRRDAVRDAGHDAPRHADVIGQDVAAAVDGRIAVGAGHDLAAVDRRLEPGAEPHAVVARQPGRAEDDAVARHVEQRIAGLGIEPERRALDPAADGEIEARQPGGEHVADPPPADGEHRVAGRGLVDQGGHARGPVADPEAQPAGGDLGPAGGEQAVVVVVGRVLRGQRVEVVVDAPAIVVGGRAHRERGRVEQRAGGAADHGDTGAAHPDHVGVADRDAVVEVDRVVAAGDRRELGVRRTGEHQGEQQREHDDAGPEHAIIITSGTAAARAIEHNHAAQRVIAGSKTRRLRQCAGPPRPPRPP